MTTACVGFGDLPGYTPIETYILEQMKIEDSVQLFLSLCNHELNRDEVIELVLRDKDFPFQNRKWIKNYTGSEDATKLRQLLETRLAGDPHWTKILHDHDMFKQMLGNPTSITVTASSYKAAKLEVYKQSPTLMKQDTMILSKQSQSCVTEEERCILANIYGGMCEGKQSIT